MSSAYPTSVHVLHVKKSSDGGTDWQSKKSLVQCLDHLLTHSLDTDVTFLLGRNGENIKAHSFILKARSPVLCKLLSAVQSQQWKISLFKYSRPTMNMFLRYIYTDTVNLTVPDAVNLVGMARQFKVSNLVDLCEVYLGENAVTEVQHTEVNTCDTEDSIVSVPPENPSPSEQIAVDNVSSALSASKAPLELKSNVDDRPKSDENISTVSDALGNSRKHRHPVDSTSKSAESSVLLTLDDSVLPKRRRQTVEVSSLTPVHQPGPKQQRVSKPSQNVGHASPVKSRSKQQQNVDIVSKPSDKIGLALPVKRGSKQQQIVDNVPKPSDNVILAVPVKLGSKQQQNLDTVSKSSDNDSLDLPIMPRSKQQQNVNSVTKPSNNIGLALPVKRGSKEQENVNSVSKASGKIDVAQSAKPLSKQQRVDSVSKSSHNDSLVLPSTSWSKQQQHVDSVSEPSDSINLAMPVKRRSNQHVDVMTKTLNNIIIAVPVKQGSKQQLIDAKSKSSENDSLVLPSTPGSKQQQQVDSVSEPSDNTGQAKPVDPVSNQPHVDSLSKQPHVDSLSKQPHVDSLSKPSDNIGLVLPAKRVSQYQHMYSVLLKPSDDSDPAIPVHTDLSQYAKDKMVSITDLESIYVDEILGKSSVANAVDGKVPSTPHLEDTELKDKTLNCPHISGKTSLKQPLGNKVSIRKTSQEQYLGNNISRNKSTGRTLVSKISEKRDLLVNVIHEKVLQANSLGSISSKPITGEKRRRDKSFDKDFQEPYKRNSILDTKSCSVQPDSAKVTVGTALAVCSGSVLDLTKRDSSLDACTKGNSSGDHNPKHYKHSVVDSHDITSTASSNDKQNLLGVSVEHHKHNTNEDIKFAGTDLVVSDRERTSVKQQIIDLKSQIEHLRADIRNNHGYLEADENNGFPNCQDDCTIVAVESGTSWRDVSDTDDAYEGNVPPTDQVTMDEESRATPLDLTTTLPRKTRRPQSEAVQKNNANRSEKVVKKKNEKKKERKKFLYKATVLKTTLTTEETANKQMCGDRESKNRKTRQQIVAEENRKPKKSVQEKETSKSHSKTLEKCEVCGETFTSAISLLIHMRDHAGEQNHQCTICGKGFTLLGALHHHMKRHEGKELMNCTICGKWYASKITFKRHSNTHKDASLKCKICGLNFETKPLYNKHMKAGKHKTASLRHKCSVCGEAFRFKWQFTKHLKIHFSLNPFKCEVCNDTFARKSGLERHLKLHKAEKSKTQGYKCRSTKIHKITTELDRPAAQVRRSHKRRRGLVSQITHSNLAQSDKHKNGLVSNDPESCLRHTNKQDSQIELTVSPELRFGSTNNPESQLEHAHSLDPLSRHTDSPNSQSRHTNSSDSQSGKPDNQDSQSRHTDSLESRSGHTDSLDLQSGHTDKQDSRSGPTDKKDSQSRHTDSLDSQSKQPYSPYSQLVQPDSPESQSIQPESPDSQSVQPDSLDSQSVQPDSLDSQSVQPESPDSQSVQPDSLDSQSVQPDSLDSQSVQTESPDSQFENTNHTKLNIEDSNQDSQLKDADSVESELTETGGTESQLTETGGTESQLTEIVGSESQLTETGGTESQFEHTDKSNTAPHVENNKREMDDFITCDICSKSFNHIEHLEAHQKSHQSKGVYECILCKKVFLKQFYLDRHYRYHSGDQCYSCDLCDEGFDRRKELLQHQFTAHNKKVAFSYSCSMCSLVFASHRSFGKHMLSHSKSLKDTSQYKRLRPKDKK